MYRILIVDNDMLSQEALEAMIAGYEQFEIVDKVTTGEKAVKVCRSCAVDLVSSGMGTCGLVGPIGVVTGWFSPDQAAVLINETAISPVLKDWIGLALICFVLPALLSFVISEFMRKKGWIQQGDYTLM